MVQGKWLKLGVAGFLSIGILAACGNDEPAEDNEDSEMQNEEDSNSNDTDSDNDSSNDEEDDEEDDSEED